MGMHIPSVGVHSANAAGIKLQTDVFDNNLCPAQERRHRGPALKRHRSARGGDHSDDIVMHLKAWIDVTHREDRAICVAGVAKIWIATKR